MITPVQSTSPLHIQSIEAQQRPAPQNQGSSISSCVPRSSIFSAIQKCLVGVWNFIVRLFSSSNFYDIAEQRLKDVKKEVSQVIQMANKGLTLLNTTDIEGFLKTHFTISTKSGDGSQSTVIESSTDYNYYTFKVSYTAQEDTTTLPLSDPTSLESLSHLLTSLKKRGEQISSQLSTGIRILESERSDITWDSLTSAVDLKRSDSHYLYRLEDDTFTREKDLTTISFSSSFAFSCYMK